MSLLSALLLHTLSCTASALDLPPDIPIVSTATATATVSYDAASGIFRYSYVVANSPGSKGSIIAFNVDVSTMAGGGTFSAAGLTTSATGYLSELSSAAFTLNGIAMIPVGVVSQPPHWLSSLSSDGFVSWFGRKTKIAPGASAGPFVLTSHAPPGIRRFIAEPPYDPNDFLPSIDDTSLSDAQLSQIGPLNTAIQAAITFHGYTVGPEDPAALGTGDAITHLATLKHQAAGQGWIGSRDFIEDLDERLDRAKDALAKGHLEDARESIEQFIDMLEKQRDAQRERRHDGRDEGERGSHREGERFITGDAYNLLKLNAEFVLSQLSGRSDRKDSDDHGDGHQH
jgi:hypothetical protein